MPKVYKSQLIEVVQPANSTATKLQFQDFPYLRGRQIFGIEAYNNLDITTSPTGKTPPTPAQSLVSFLTLYLDDRTEGAKNVGEWIQNVPFTSLHRTDVTIYTTTANAYTQPPFVVQMYELTGQIIYWEKCFLNFGSWSAVATDVSFCFNVYFK